MPAVTRSSQVSHHRSPEKRIKSKKPAEKRRSIFQKINPTVWVPRLLFDPAYFWTTGCFVIVLEVFLCIFVVLKVPYTEIDWLAYMQQAETFLNGSWNYTAIEGGTGPLVYPAGHLYLYSALYLVTSKGTQIFLAQWIFMALYLLTLVVVFRIYQKAQKVPPYVIFFMCCGSYRVHSIFILRLFNDPVAMLIFYCAVLLWLHNRWTVGCMVYSLAVSVKMNILLFSPALFAVLLVKEGRFRTFCHIFNCAVIQVLLGVPFLATNPLGYLLRSFELSRQFFFQWTVNWRFIPEWLFLDRRFQLALLAGHLSMLLFFGFILWFRKGGGICKLLAEQKRVAPNTVDNLDEILFALFSANLIGMAFARTLHYQFYSWYFHSLPFLLWSTNFPPVMNLATMGVMEMIWNTYPSTIESSLSLNVIHLLILAGLAYSKLKERGTLDSEKKKIT